jgi:hypothetical protein
MAHKLTVLVTIPRGTAVLLSGYSGQWRRHRSKDELAKSL